MKGWKFVFVCLWDFFFPGKKKTKPLHVKWNVNSRLQEFKVTAAKQNVFSHHTIPASHLLHVPFQKIFDTFAFTPVVKQQSRLLLCFLISPNLCVRPKSLACCLVTFPLLWQLKSTVKHLCIYAGLIVGCVKLSAPVLISSNLEPVLYKNIEMTIRTCKYQQSTFARESFCFFLNVFIISHVFVFDQAKKKKKKPLDRQSNWNSNV